ncbi:MAG: aldose 1-epimerase [Luteimonas sp.]
MSSSFRDASDCVSIRSDAARSPAHNPADVIVGAMEAADSSTAAGVGRTLSAGHLTARFLPEQGMVCASLRHRDAELLRRVDDMAADAATGHVAGVPITHPWANRLSRWSYCAAGKDVELDPESPLLHRDWNGTCIHGVPWSRLAFQVIDAADDFLAASLEWTAPELLAVFPYPHTLRIEAALDADGLEIATIVVAHADGPVPVSFGFHPYVGLPGLPRREWQLTLPSMVHLELDERLIPTGRRFPFAAMDRPLGSLEFDDGFALGTEQAVFAISGGGRRVSMQFLRGYDHAQIYAPADQDLIALEPMTAPANALVSGDGLGILAAGSRYDAVFRIGVDE